MNWWMIIWSLLISMILANDTPSQIKCVGLFDLTGVDGEENISGAELQKVFKYAVSYVNERLPDNIHINITYEDTQSAESLTVLEKKIKNGKYSDYLCYIGPYSSTNTLSLLQLVDSQLIISYSASTNISADTSRFVRVNCLGQWQSEAIASFIESMNWKRIAVIYSDEAMGSDQFYSLREQCDKRNISIDINIPINPNEYQSNDANINSMEWFRCYHIIVVIVKPRWTKLVVKTATEKGMNTADYVYLFVTAAVHSFSEFQEYAGNLTNWVAFVPGYGPLYDSLNKTEISQSRNLHSTHVFDSALVLYYAIRSMLENGMLTNNTTALEWREEILRLPVINGSSGLLDFGPDGNRIIDKVILIINSFEKKNNLSYTQWNDGEILNLNPQSFFLNGYIPNDYHCHFPGVVPLNSILIIVFTLGGLAILILVIALISYRIIRIKRTKFQ